MSAIFLLGLTKPAMYVLQTDSLDDLGEHYKADSFIDLLSVFSEEGYNCPVVWQGMVYQGRKHMFLPLAARGSRVQGILDNNPLRVVSGTVVTSDIFSMKLSEISFVFDPSPPEDLVLTMQGEGNIFASNGPLYEKFIFQPLLSSSC